MNCHPPSDIYSDIDYLDIQPPEQFDPSFSDDLEALHAQEVDIIAENKRRGIVIQHRSWPLVEAFRSDDERGFGKALVLSSAIICR